MNRSDWVADASAILASLKSEPITNIDPDLLVGALISSVNLSEVVQKLIADGIGENHVEEAVSSLDLRVIPFDHRQAVAAARLWAHTRTAGLSLADRACIGLGIGTGLPVVTADRVWASLDLGVDVILIR
ncbi:MAG TPA: type II toxin-antitoxin system VapC family toxin [Stellaceae bacterium]|nr:type II toxin-antitoxin system VapC family toxin [Stellaceae bacterium]